MKIDELIEKVLTKEQIPHDSFELISKGSKTYNVKVTVGNAYRNFKIDKFSQKLKKDLYAA